MVQNLVALVTFLLIWEQGLFVHKLDSDWSSTVVLAMSRELNQTLFKTLEIYF